MPVPEGMITVTLTRKNKNGIEGEIVLPEKLTGRFIWNGKEIGLHGGRQEISL
jgi:hypothetical protein